MKTIYYICILASVAQIAFAQNQNAPEPFTREHEALYRVEVIQITPKDGLHGAQIFINGHYIKQPYSITYDLDQNRVFYPYNIYINNVRVYPPLKGEKQMRGNIGTWADGILNVKQSAVIDQQSLNQFADILIYAEKYYRQLQLNNHDKKSIELLNTLKSYFATIHGIDNVTDTVCNTKKAIYLEYMGLYQIVTYSFDSQMEEMNSINQRINSIKKNITVYNRDGFYNYFDGLNAQFPMSKKGAEKIIDILMNSKLSQEDKYNRLKLEGYWDNNIFNMIYNFDPKEMELK